MQRLVRGPGLLLGELNYPDLKRGLGLDRYERRHGLDGITVSKMNLNACLDAMGVGQDFDLAGFFGAGMQMPSMLGGT